jgi:hypothetical protein
MVKVAHTIIKTVTHKQIFLKKQAIFTVLGHVAPP